MLDECIVTCSKAKDIMRVGSPTVCIDGWAIHERRSISVVNSKALKPWGDNVAGNAKRCDFPCLQA